MPLGCTIDTRKKLTSVYHTSTRLLIHIKNKNIIILKTGASGQMSGLRLPIAVPLGSVYTNCGTFSITAFPLNH